MEENKVSKFKVGDRVRAIKGDSVYFRVGDLGTVTEVEEKYARYVVKFDAPYFGTGEWNAWDTHLELVKEAPKFKVGDTVYLLPGAHGSEDSYSSHPEKFLEFLVEHGMSFDAPWVADCGVDDEGDVRILQDGIALCVLEKFLTEEKPETPEPAPRKSIAERYTTQKPEPEPTVTLAKLIEACEFLGGCSDSAMEKYFHLATRLK